MTTTYVPTLVVGVTLLTDIIYLHQIHTGMIKNAEENEEKYKLLGLREHAKIGYIECCLIIFLNVVAWVSCILTGVRFSGGPLTALIVGLIVQTLLLVGAIFFVFRKLDKEMAKPQESNKLVKSLVTTSEDLLAGAIDDNFNAMGLAIAAAGTTFVLTIVYATDRKSADAYAYTLALASISVALPFTRSVLRYWGAIKRWDSANKVKVQNSNPQYYITDQQLRHMPKQLDELDCTIRQSHNDIIQLLQQIKQNFANTAG